MREQKGTPMSEMPTVVTKSSSVERFLNSEVLSSHVAYNEMADVPVHYVDPVAEVQKNLAHLEELQVRMKFMMREVRYLMKL